MELAGAKAKGSNEWEHISEGPSLHVGSQMKCSLVASQTYLHGTRTIKHLKTADQQKKKQNKKEQEQYLC